MKQQIRQQHLGFITEDLKQRGETPFSSITFFGALYQLKVMKEGEKVSKTVTYSAAERLLKGYRKIQIDPLSKNL